MASADVVNGLKLTVVGAAGRMDLVVPWSADVGTIADAYAEYAGLNEPPRLCDIRGTELVPERGVEESGLRLGSFVMADPTLAPAAASPQADAANTSSEDHSAFVRWGAAGLAVVAAVAAGASSGHSLLLVVAGLLLVGAVMALLPTRISLPAPVGPAFAAAAGFCVVQAGQPGELLLGVAVGGLAACATAAIMRSWGTETYSEYTQVWLIGGLSTALAASALLLLGVNASHLWALGLGAAVIVARFAPSMAVDVPDQQLLDLDRLAVTAWSAREQPRRGRARQLVREAAVADMQKSGQRVVTAIAFALGFVVAVSAPAMAVTADGTTVRIGAMLLLGFGGSALVFIARSHRATAPRWAMRMAGVWSYVVLGGMLASEYDSAWLIYLVAVAAVIGIATLVAAVAIGRGWRSVWWARMGEIGEALSFVFAIAAVPLATGLFDFVRGLTS